ncbi:Pentatricopeptide repeat-containing protein [Camellia lanceoleosa]|uniref:Pentatricopeptide repeat-containing protein n=1 Tax=Camellia lanceoleosa TaxID=1840588 RepID=A0ACC0J2Q2_9ERIC|nr:Pentatricopeptide repeat-containing protein [Camellia lanceoleosa]
MDEVRSLARDHGLKKTPGWSSIELNNMIDVFYTENQSYSYCEEIYKELEILAATIKITGYIPDYSFVLLDVEEDEKEYILMSHSEKLAIAYGIISTPPMSPIWIFKNLRICVDCHNVTKFISKITEREIIVKDSNRFHHFKDLFLWGLLVTWNTDISFRKLTVWITDFVFQPFKQKHNAELP